MTLEQVLEMAFLQEVKPSGQLWVIKSGFDTIYAEKSEPAGFSVPIWSNKESALAFLVNAQLAEPRYEPVAISLVDFTDKWLSDKTMSISEVQLNPDGKSEEVLVLSPEDFRVDATLGPADMTETTH